MRERPPATTPRVRSHHRISSDPTRSGTRKVRDEGSVVSLRSARPKPDAAPRATTQSKVSGTQPASRITSRRRSSPTSGPRSRPRNRLLVILFLLIGVLGAVLAQVGAIQIAAKGVELREEGARQWTRTARLSSDRGTIFDRNGEELAMSVPASTISINPRLITDPEATLATLMAILPLTEDKIASLRTEMQTQERGFVYVARQIPTEIGAQISALRMIGVNVDSEPRRILPGGDTGRSVIGRTDIDGIGIAGLELQYEDLLTGAGGEVTRQVAPGGRSIPGTEEVTRRPVPGDDLVVTIDRSIQFSCEQALINQVSRIGAKGATCVVMDTRNGEIYAMASVRRNSESGRVEVSSGNFAMVDADEPGSVAKVITVAAALDLGVVTPETVFSVPWREQYYDDLLSDAWQHPEEDWSVTDILVTSSNIGTIKIWEQIGRERHWNYLREFGLGEPTALGFPGESGGILKDWTDLWGSERVTVSYGQGLASTSMQLAAAVNVIANNGVYVEPRLVRSIIDSEGTVTDFPPSATRQVVSAEAAGQVRDMLIDVVCVGTATEARVSNFTVAGKTGTGLKAQPNGTYLNEFGQRVYYASFVGFFPAEDPQITLLITVDEPPAGSRDRFGGTAAAPVFARMAPTIVHERNIQPPENSVGCPDR
jgi:cell division protein FtsI (penicillin-binding protein 3)